MTYSAACFSTVFLNSTRRVALVEQELFTLPEHLSAPPRFLVEFVLLDLYFYMYEEPLIL
jgi:hypothetical protein